MSASHDSWGRTRRVERRATRSLRPLAEGGSCLPFGNGRSYGDSCHNDRGTLLDRRGDAGILSFDTQSGVIRARAGTMLADLVALALPRGLFPPVVPGTRFVTLGGAFANDVHGKNHHRRGTFAAHVERFRLDRSDGTTIVERGDPLFTTTAGGMGLTGVIRWLDIRMMRVPGGALAQRATPFASLDGYFERSGDADAEHEYSVAWIDALATGKGLGRGVLLSGDHCEGDARIAARPRLSVPFAPPLPLVARPTVRAFNPLYAAAQAKRPERVVPAGTFFWPLDGVAHWNRLYGPRGLHQHQSVVPLDAASALAALLRATQQADHVSFLTVLKRFGAAPAEGALSFPREGYTLTLDLPHRGPRTLALLDRLDAITLEAGGRANAYKDGRMLAATFQRGFPRWGEVEAARDPVMMSDFWRRCASRAVVDAPSLEPEPAREDAVA